MLEKEAFNQLTALVYSQIFESFESFDPDLVEADYSLDNITITFHDKTRFIVNRQIPVKQIWLATKKRGYHFNYDEKQKKWFCDRNSGEFSEVFSKNVREIINQNYQLELKC